MNDPHSESLIVIVMGVSGCGKSTVAALIAKSLNIEFLDADDLHPVENKQMMSAGIALTDENRVVTVTIDSTPKEVADNAILALAQMGLCI